MEIPYVPGGYIPRHSQNTRTQDTSIFKTEPEITPEDEEALDGSFEKIWKSPVLTRPNKNKDLNESENIGKHTASKILGILCATIIPNFAQLHVSRNLQAHWIPVVPSIWVPWTGSAGSFLPHTPRPLARKDALIGMAQFDLIARTLRAFSVPPTPYTLNPKWCCGCLRRCHCPQRGYGNKLSLPLLATTMVTTTMGIPAVATINYRISLASTLAIATLTTSINTIHLSVDAKNR